MVTDYIDTEKLTCNCRIALHVSSKTKLCFVRDAISLLCNKAVRKKHKQNERKYRNDIPASQNSRYALMCTFDRNVKLVVGKQC